MMLLELSGKKRAAEKKGWSGFSLWASRTSAEEKAETIN